MIAFACPYCGANLKVDDSLAGVKGACPACSRVVRAPSGPSDSSAARSPGGRTVRPPASSEDTASDLPELAPPPDYPFLGAPQEADELGRLGPYRVLKVLGVGSMGVVFLAEDLHLKRPVALKAMRPSLAASDDYHRRFLREAQLAAAIDHEHVVTVYQVGEDRGVPYLAMKLLRGETLEDRLNNSGGRLPLPEVLRIGREIAEGLAAAHARGLIHRDIKPANLWLEEGRGRVKIVDFGLARGTGPDAHFTQAGAVIGTPSYMAPEQANAGEVDARSDLFSLGTVLYRAATGVLPFEGADTLTVLTALATRTPTPPHKVVRSLSRAFSALVMRLLSKDPTERPQTAREVVRAIAALERGEVDEPADEPDPPAPQESSPDEETTATVTKRKGPPKGKRRAVRRAKPQEAGTDWGRVVLIGSIVLLGLAVVLLLVAAVLHLTRGRTAAADTHPQGAVAIVQAFRPATRNPNPRERLRLGISRPSV